MVLAEFTVSCKYNVSYLQIDPVYLQHCSDIYSNIKYKLIAKKTLEFNVKIIQHINFICQVH